MSDDPNPEETLSEPLHLSRICVEKVWGGRALERVLGLELPPDRPIGETWELVDRDDHNSTVVGGRFEGQSLRWLMANEREALLGDAATSESDQFPLLVKFISAEAPLSVQVHPDEKMAKKLGKGDAGKCEAWYVLDAEPGSLLYLGLRPNVDATDFAAAADSADVVDLLQTWNVQPGQFIWVPAGTVHAIGAGITLLEVQQNSDVTFRVFDWGRLGLDGKPRKTHVDQALLAVNYDLDTAGPVDPELHVLDDDSRGVELLDCEFFRMGLLEVCGHVRRKGLGRPVVLVCVAGRGRILRHGADAQEFGRGDTWLVPAAAGDWTIESKGGECRLVLVEAKAKR
ncbi:MAG: class I mannose-6-phosphate isomerase [Planctomycetes bacterium]|nr:class I mannose-6-phosphate isomerase [Planctomycetota bacterium]